LEGENIQGMQYSRFSKKTLSLSLGVLVCVIGFGSLGSSLSLRAADFSAYPQNQYNTDKLYSVIGKSIAFLPIRPEYNAPVAMWSMGKVGYKTQIFMGQPIPYWNIHPSKINKQNVNNVNSYLTKSPNLFVPVYSDGNSLGWVYVEVSGTKNPQYKPSHIGYLNLANQWERINAYWTPKGANPHLVFDKENHQAYFTLPNRGSNNLTPVFNSKISAPIKTKKLFGEILKK
jgi:hypothetical protein